MPAVNCSNFISGVACVLCLDSVKNLENIWMWFAYDSFQSPSTCTLTARLKFKYVPYNIAVHFMEINLMGVGPVGS